VAHVEASTVGRIILAGLLLKLGRLGLYYLIMYINFMIKFHWLRFSVPLVMLIILRLSDLKIIIAYSSVAHIRIVFYILIIGSFIAKKGRLIIMFYHGVISPLMF
jgi:NADH:ubiquinone oxidoreductase subunit 4 (subunit M)